jgi:predicted acyltransferase
VGDGLSEGMSTSSASPPLDVQRNPRLLSLDAFRGLTILGMILVNNPGDWDHIYGPLAHARWFGWTPTDLIFPFFLFIVGTSLAYSLRKYRDGVAVSSAVYWRIARRTATLILLGWGMGLFAKCCNIAAGSATSIDLSTLRLPGVLVRIGLVYFAASLIVLHVPVRGQAVLGTVLLLGYWGLLRWTPNPHDYDANLSRKGNVVRVVDRALMSDRHLYTQGKDEPTDPEGLLSTMPAIVTTLLGYWVGLFIQRRGVNWRTVVLLALCGAACAGVGLAWDQLLPIGKKLWTSSFVMLTGGLAMICLAACLAVFDVAGWRRLARPFEIVGINAIFVFVASGMLAKVLASTQIGGQSTHGFIYQKLFTDHLADPRLASLGMALLTVVFWWLVLWVMSRFKLSVRV